VRAHLAFPALAVLSFVATTSCTTIRVSTDYDPHTDLTSLRTYGWRARKVDESRDPRLDNSLLDARIRGAVDRELSARGIRNVSENPDFEVGYDIVLEKDVRFTTTGGWYYPAGAWGWGWGGWAYPQTYGRAYDRTVLILDFNDPASGNLLWRGMAQGNLIDDATPEEREAQVDATVAAILERFRPPAR
jgi:hypothetical protein